MKNNADPQVKSIAGSKHKDFIDSYLVMLRACEKIAHRDRDVILKNWVEGGARVWKRMTGQAISLVWADAGMPSPTLVSTDKVPKKDQEDALHLFWVLMGSCETDADDNDDSDLKSLVEAWYKQWNGITFSTNSPTWVTRAEKLQRSAS